MTPEVLKGLIDAATHAIEFGPQILEEFIGSKRPDTVNDAILNRVFAKMREAPPGSSLPTNPRSAPLPAISRDSTGSWQVAGIEMTFLTKSDAVTAARVIALVRDAEREGGAS
jgi:hypothetical protein